MIDIMFFLFFLLMQVGLVNVAKLNFYWRNPVYLDGKID